MEFRDLSYFLLVARLGHLGRAAERLRLTQPALTKSIARLERDLGVPLFERAGRGVALTVYGRHLAAHAERAQAAETDIRRELTELATGHAGTIRVGTGTVLAQHVLPKACVRLFERHPRITVEVSIGNTDTLFPALRERRMDIVLASIGARAAPGFRQVFLAQDRVAVIARKGHRLNRPGRIHPASLAQERWAMPASNTAPAEWLRQRCLQLGIPPLDAVLRTGALPTLLRIVADTDLLAFQSWPVVQRTNDYGTMLRPLKVPELTWARDVGATVRDDERLSPAVERLLDALKETVEAPDTAV